MIINILLVYTPFPSSINTKQQTLVWILLKNVQNSFLTLEQSKSCRWIRDPSVYSSHANILTAALGWPNRRFGNQCDARRDLRPHMQRLDPNRKLDGKVATHSWQDPSPDSSNGRLPHNCWGHCKDRMSESFVWVDEAIFLAQTGGERGKRLFYTSSSVVIEKICYLP